MPKYIAGTYRGIDQSLASAHRVKEELGAGQTRVE
jgi:hypothetical protein